MTAFAHVQTPWAALMCGVALAMACAVPANTAAGTLVPRQSTWKYYAGPTDPGAGWQSPAFADTSWQTGTAPLGYGEAYIATTLPFGGNPANVWISYYFRKTFFLGEDPAQFISLDLGLNYDDGAIVYLNGVEVARRSMPAGTVTWGTFGFDHEALNTYEAINLSSSIGLLQGNAMNTIAVEVHQRSTNSTDLVMDLELKGFTTPSVIRGPYLQNGAPYEMTIRWRTNVNTDSRVYYGNTLHNLSQIADDPTPVTEHEIRLTGLTSHTRYYYAIGTSEGPMAGDDDSTYFRTNPFPGDPYPTRVWVIGDAGFNSAGQRQVRAAYETWTGDRHTDLWLMLGDNAYTTGTDLEYQSGAFDIYRGMLRKSCLWTTRGNHDLIYGGPSDDYYDFFTLPTAAEAGGLPSGTEAYYSFDFGNIHFICLDTEGTDLATGGAMASWLRQDVAATDKTWTIAFWHHPPYSKGSHDSDNDLDSFGKMGNVRRNMLPILDSTGVDLVLCGHSHSYERSYLLNGHYETSNMLAAPMILDSGQGRFGIDGAYVKPTLGSGPFEGAVYVVAGSAGTTSGGTLDHPAMTVSFNLLGSLVLDIQGNRLDAHFVGNTEVALDSFTIMKGPGITAVGQPPQPGSISLAVKSANPTTRATRLDFTLPRPGYARLEIVDGSGRRVARLAAGETGAGTHRAEWNGRDRHGVPAPAGVYFAVLESGAERRAVKILLVR